MWDAPTGTQWEIEHGPHVATIVELGGGVRTYDVDGAPVLDGYPRDALPGSGAGQVLAPWPNRLRDGRWLLDGSACVLPIGEPELGNALHGLVRWLPWRLVEHGSSHVTVSCVLAPSPGYPRALELTTRWSVGDTGLRADHTATNLGRRHAPFGLGVHPYVLTGADPVLRVPAATRLVVDDRKSPVRPEDVAGTDHDFRTARRVGGLDLDTTFGDLRRDAGLCEVTASGPDGGATVWLGEAFRWAHVFTGGKPAGVAGRSVAVEPMTCPPDALRSGADLVVLAPGARWHGSWGVTPRR